VSGLVKVQSNNDDKSKIPFSFRNENDHLDDNSFDEVLEVNSPSADPNESNKPACSEAGPKSSLSQRNRNNFPLLLSSKKLMTTVVMFLKSYYISF